MTAGPPPRSSPRSPPRTPRLLVLRPEPGAHATLEAARALGLAAQAYPLFEIRPRAWPALDPADVDALLIGSANALRHGGADLDRYRGKPAYCVGAKTAEAAHDAGLDVVFTGKGGLQATLAALAPGHARLLRLAGRERVTLSPPAGVTIATREVYASEALPACEGLHRELLHAQEGLVALLHSGEAAARFEELCLAWEIPTHFVHLAAIGPRVSSRLHARWGRVQDAIEPSDTALLALAAQMCQEIATGSVQADNHT